MSNQGQEITRYFVYVQTVISARSMQVGISQFRLGTAHILGAHTRTGGTE